MRVCSVSDREVPLLESFILWVSGISPDSVESDFFSGSCADPLEQAGYGAYTSWLNKKSHAKEKVSIIHAACWAHARRKFAEVPGNRNELNQFVL
ncbi:IS66 family transposase [Pontiella sulfatireligans]|uniref:IS66 family transposase n=1 Tax=Pontiella sulfatireligans TaxID=2750658 RepID=UPI00109CF185